MIPFITRMIRRQFYALAGLWFALRKDFSFRWQIILFGLFSLAFGFYEWPLTQTELLFLVLAYVLVLITELQNSSFEGALDHLHPEMHSNIGRSKDLAAGAVLLACLFYLFVVVVIFLS